MGYWKLFTAHPRTIGFGFLTAFFSGLGQTHFISIFSPLIMAQFQLSNGQYGSLYSLVTLISGFAISFIGPLIDKKDVRFFSFFVGIGLIISQCFLLFNSSIIFLFIGLLGLRLFGQGLCSSLSSITVARYFTKQRGKALALSQMGYPFYEGLITPLGAFALSFLSFKSLSLIIIGAVTFLYIPLTSSLTRLIPEFNKPSGNTSPERSSTKKPSQGWSRKQVFSDKTIYLLLPQTLIPPFALTGLFFHQAAIAQTKDWSLSLMALGLSFFALGRVVNTFITGPLVDRYKAYRLFPFYQLPLSLSFLLLALFTSSLTPSFCFFLFGLSVGSGGPIKSAIWAELYGVTHLGALKSLFATIMVFSTAVSPALFGFIIDYQKSAQPLLITLCAVSFCSSFLAYWGLKTSKIQRIL